MGALNFINLLKLPITNKYTTFFPSATKKITFLNKLSLVPIKLVLI